MKCQYCGGNLGLDNEVCPFCGRENTKAKKYIDTKQDYQKELVETKKKVKTLVKVNARTGRCIFIALMLVIIVFMNKSIKQYDDFDARIGKREQKLSDTVEKNIDSISATVREMEQNREYLALSYYALNYELSHHDEFREYTRVFTAVVSYRSVFEDILNITTGFDYYGEKNVSDWCRGIANTISNWNKYVDGEFWGDRSDSPMHLGEHGAFLKDIKGEVQDMVQVYFELDDEMANDMWTMGEETLYQTLYEQYTSINPEVNINE